MSIWNRDTAWLLALVLLGALLVVVHVALWLRVLRTPEVRRWLRWFAWLPPLTPLAGFRARARGLSLLWCIVAIAYLVLRTRA